MEDFMVLYKIYGHDQIRYLFIQRTYDADDATVDYSVFNHDKEFYDGGQLDIDLDGIDNTDDIAEEIMQGYGCEKFELIDDDVDDLEELGFRGM